MYCLCTLYLLPPIVHNKESRKISWNPPIQNQLELCLPKTPGSIRSQSCSSCKLLSSLCDTSVTVQGVYKKYEWARADLFIKILAKWEVAFLTLFLRKWVLHGGTCLPVPPPSPSNLPAQGQISNPSGQDYSTEATNNSKCYGNQRFRRNYIIFPHGREGWHRGELLSGIGEATQEGVDWQKDRNSIHQPNPNMQPLSSAGFWPQLNKIWRLLTVWAAHPDTESAHCLKSPPCLTALPSPRFSIPHHAWIS